ncbi:MAG: ATP-dependent DNA helicase RecG [Elusimicrobia bacterium]|nr:ATP-dependent DNA helicase RecG [Elusimicrobiota bacterium]
MNLTSAINHSVVAERMDLSTPIQFVKGVGPSKAQLLEKLGIKTVEDLLYHFPRGHQDRKIVLLKDAVPKEKQAFLVDVQSIEFLRSGKMLGQARALVKDSSSLMAAVWFKRLSFKYDVFSALKRDIIPGRRVLLYGGIEHGDHAPELRVEDYEIATEGTDSGKIVPIYPLTEGLYDKWLRTLAFRIVAQSSGQVFDPLPLTLRQKQNLSPYVQALRNFHFPPSWSERDRARERLAFDEFFFLELALAINRSQRDQTPKGLTYAVKRNLLTPFRKQMGFEFTVPQTRVINEIFRDMQRPTPMNRLLQGDVGSGKTVVALSAALLAIENGYQVAFLAPTEILAGQHHLSLARLFSGLPVQSELLTGSTPSAERKKILNKLKEGKIHLLVGTHAILNEGVAFDKLALAIIDEQHRFGVRQRAKLLAKTGNPDVLIMTATPIPRTLAMTLYGDLDVSIIDHLPGGRSPIKTSLTTREQAFTKIEQELKIGRQAYLVFPLVEASELLTKKAGKLISAAVKEFDLVQKRFSNFKIGLLHGQMKAEEKKQVMDRFRMGHLSLLVATPVIEVGIDIPNATVIGILNPERFGLAQLHQLRGRVGRGDHPSECLLIQDSTDEILNERLDLFCLIRDGFKLAEEDLKLRGPGEFLGEAQHGLPLFKVGDLINDGLLLSRARESAKALVAGEMALTMKEFGELNRILQKRFGSKLSLSKVG